MLDLLNLPGIKPVDMYKDTKALIIVAEPESVEVPVCGDCNIPVMDLVNNELFIRKGNAPDAEFEFFQTS